MNHENSRTADVCPICNSPIPQTGQQECPLCGSLVENGEVYNHGESHMSSLR